MSTAYLPDGTKITLHGNSLTFSKTENWYGREETSGLTIDMKCVSMNIIITALSNLQTQKSYEEW